MNSRLVRYAEQVRQSLTAEQQALQQLYVVTDQTHALIEAAIASGTAPDKEALQNQFKVLNNVALNLQSLRESRLRGADVLSKEVLAEAGISEEVLQLLPSLHTNVSGNAATADMLLPGGSVSVSAGGSFRVAGENVATWSHVNQAVQSVHGAIEAAHGSALQQIGQLQLLEQSCLTLLTRAEEVALECRDAINVERIVGWNQNVHEQLNVYQTELNGIRLRLNELERTISDYNSYITQAEALLASTSGLLTSIKTSMDVAVEDEYALRAGLAVPRLLDLNVLASQLDRLERVEHLVTAGWPDIGVLEPQLRDLMRKAINGHLLKHSLPILLQRYILPVLTGVQPGDSLTPLAEMDMDTLLNLGDSLEESMLSYDFVTMAKNVLVRVSQHVATLCESFIGLGNGQQLAISDSQAESRLQNLRHKMLEGGNLWRIEDFEYALPVSSRVIHGHQKQSVELAGRHAGLRALVPVYRKVEDLQQAVILQSGEVPTLLGQTLSVTNQRLDLGQYNRVARGLFFAGTMQHARRVNNLTGNTVPGSITYLCADLGPTNTARFGLTAQQMKFEYIRALQLGKIIVPLPGIDKYNSVESKARGLLILMAPNRRDITVLNDIAYMVTTDDTDPVDLRACLEALYQHPDPVAAETLQNAGLTVVNSTGNTEFLLLNTGGVTLQMSMMFSGIGTQLRNCAPFAMYVAYGGEAEVDNFEPLISDGVPFNAVHTSYRHTVALDAGGISWNYGRVSEISKRAVAPLVIDVSNVTRNVNDWVEVNVLQVAQGVPTVGASGVGVSFESESPLGGEAFKVTKGGSTWWLPVTEFPHAVAAGGPGYLPFIDFNKYNTVDSDMRFFVQESVWQSEGHQLSRIFGFPNQVFSYQARALEERHGNVGIHTPSAMYVEPNGQLWNLNMLDRQTTLGEQSTSFNVKSRLESADLTERVWGLELLPYVAFQVGIDTMMLALQHYQTTTTHTSWQSAYRRMTVLDLSTIVGLPMAPAYTLSMAQLRNGSPVTPMLNGQSLPLLVLSCVSGQYRGAVEVNIPVSVYLSKSNGVLEKNFTGATSSVQYDMLLRPSASVPQGFSDDGLRTLQGIIGGVTIDINPIVSAFVSDSRPSMHVTFTFHVVLRPRTIEPAVDLPANLGPFVVCETLGEASNVSQYVAASLSDETISALYIPRNTRICPPLPDLNIPDVSLQSLMQWQSNAAVLHQSLVDMQTTLGTNWPFALSL